MRRELLDILACPIDKYNKLELYELSYSNEIDEGVLYCPQCSRFYPIINSIPILLPDNLRNRNNELVFLKRWKDKLPEKIINKSKPWHI
mgnify:CR=1 FL=1